MEGIQLWISASRRILLLLQILSLDTPITSLKNEKKRLTLTHGFLFVLSGKSYHKAR